ncbi:MAG: hypothetical protein IMF07_04525 [Proteobacteria bacterium]|nr:hypothetical protein [Pseudomonadota bacterium]
MKKNGTLFLAVTGIILFGSINLHAGEFSDYSNEELIQKRSDMQGMNEEDRKIFREEMQKRMGDMNKEDRRQFLKEMGANVSRPEQATDRDSAESTKRRERSRNYDEEQKETMKSERGSKSGKRDGSGKSGGGMSGRRGSGGR